MGLGYLCKPSLKLVIVAWDGIVTWDDWHEHIQWMLSDPDYAAMQLQITDLRFSTIDPTISANRIPEMIGLMSAQRKKISLAKLAMVAGTEWRKPKLLEFAIQSISVNSIVFNDLATACAWLDVDVVEVGRDIQQIRLRLRQNP